MGAFDAAGFLISLSSMSASVSLLLSLLALLKGRLLTRYRARTFYQLGLLLIVLLLCPWRPALLLPRITLPAAQIQGAVVSTKDASLPSAQNAQASAKTDDKAAGMVDGISPEATAVKNSDGTEELAGSSPSNGRSAQQRFGIPWAQVLFAVWLSGTLAVLLFQMIRHARFLLLIRRWQSPVAPEVQAVLSERCAYLRITQPRACTAPCVQSPTVVGLLRPMLLLPEIQYDPQQLSLMLTHELIHLKHGHLWGKAFCCLVSAVHWFNPLMPFLMKEMGLLCEMACDETVLTFQEPEHRNTYVDAILSAALLTKKVRTPLCSPFDGGVKQMNRIKQRISLMTPFRPRRAGAGLIVCTLVLALLTGSVLAGEIPASAFSITEYNFLIPESEYMPQSDFDLLMSMQTPGWEELSTEEYAKQITPQLSKLKVIFDQRWLENRFMRHLQYSVAEASNPDGDSYKVPWSTSCWRDDQDGDVAFFCELNWKYPENVKLTNGERNRLLDDVLMNADRAVRTQKVSQIQAVYTFENSGELGVQLNKIAKDLGGKSLSIWFTGILIDTDQQNDSQLSKEQRELISLLTPEGYLDQTVADYQAFLEEYKDHFDQNAQSAIRCTVNKAVNEAYGEMTGNPTCQFINSVDLSLMPAWTIRGSIDYTCQLHWKTVDPSHITVGERHVAISRLMTRLRDAAVDIAWEASDWETFDKALKERLPILAQEESIPALAFTVPEVELEIIPLATEEYVFSTPKHVLLAFAIACRDQDTARMADVCAPVGTDSTNAGVSDAREELLKSIMELKPYHWTFGEARNEPGKDDSVTVDVNFYLDSQNISETPAEESRQARLTQIDGKWYLVPESLKP
jgi:beta-lactamase regulating signal transducer with metallopeptidase domain